MNKYELMANMMADQLIADDIIAEEKKAEVVAIWTSLCKGMIDYMELKGVPTVDGTAGTIAFGGE